MPRKKVNNTQAEAIRILANAIIWLGGRGRGEYRGSNDPEVASTAFEALSAARDGFVGEKEMGAYERDPS